MNGRSYRGLIWALALVGLVADQAAKYGVFKWLHDSDHYDARSLRGVYDVVPGAFRLLAQYSEDEEAGVDYASWLRTISADRLPQVNHGALFGLGNEYVHAANAAFAAVSIAAALAIIYWSRRSSTARDPVLCVALGLILGGTLGNLYDRLVFHGVRDFLYYYLWVDFPVFNVADCCLVCGAFLLMVQAFLAKPVPSSSAAPGALAGQMAEVK